jgi:peptide/nickel transport system ATP-binding protein
MTEVVLEARDLHRTYDVSRGLGGRRATVFAVNGVSLAIERGAIVGLVGESGCGKSTLVRLLLGLEPPTAGTVLVGDRPISGISRLDLTRRLQVVFQDPNSSLNPRKSVLSIVTLPLRVHGIGDRREQERRALEMLALVGLPRRTLAAVPRELSGGQRQRVAIARALIMRPEIVICDEPTSALDVSVQAQILNLLLDLRQELGLTYLVISHNLAVVEAMATRVAVMYLGRVVEENDASTLFAQPRHPYTRILLKSILLPEPGGALPEIPLGLSFPNPLSPPSGCRFHPRCPDAMPTCSTLAPVLTRDERGGSVECHLYRQAI